MVFSSPQKKATFPTPRMPLSDPTKELVAKWMAWDLNTSTIEEIASLVERGDEEELKKRLSERIKFGTAGLRGKMQAGFSFMNDLTVIQASQGLVKSVESVFANGAPEGVELGVCIGHDARHHSSTFARLAASAFLSRGIPVYLFPVIVPTPLVVCGSCMTI